MAALAHNTNFTYALAQVTPMYTGRSQVSKVEREYLFLRPGTFVVFDRVVTAGAGIARIWTLNTPGAPTINGDRLSYVSGANRLDVYRLAPTGLTAATTIVDGGTRIDVADRAGTQSLFLHVIDTNGAGDTHLGAMLAARSDGLDWRGSLTLANRAAAFAITRRGAASGPTRLDLGLRSPSSWPGRTP